MAWARLVAGMVCMGWMAYAVADQGYPFHVSWAREPGGSALVATNDGNAPISVVATLALAENVASDASWPVRAVVPPRSRSTLARIRPANPSRPWTARHRSSYRLGAFTAVHDASARYRLPYLDGRTFTFAQAPGGPVTTHDDAGSRYAVDIAMPEGTPIVAARGGLVVTSISRHVVGGKSEELMAAANAVRILHSDGTIGTYAHLMPSGAAVDVGDVVQEGRLIGYSGSTGYSGGPHLHFDVNRTVLADDELTEVSEPVQFYVGNPPYAFTARTGLSVTADYVSPGESPELVQRRRAALMRAARRARQ
jgi:murein DD-endopeptidase MepM/ murein hydrolase activator NlpD